MDEVSCDRVSGAACELADLPTTGRLHYLAAISVFGGVISDGYAFGSIGAVLPTAASSLGSSLWDVGAIGSGTLFGLFSGSLVVGTAADRFGRKPLLCLGMALTAILSLLQGVVTSDFQLVVLRFLMGVTLASDYVAGPCYQSELARNSQRGYLLGTMMLFWGIGFAFAYQAGFFLCNGHPNGWRWCLMLGALPSSLTCALRLWLPESPVWLHSRSRTEEAIRVTKRHFPQHDVIFPAIERREEEVHSWRALLSRNISGKILIAITIILGQIVPYFMVGIFLLRILSEIGIKSPYLGGVIYTLFVILGSALGAVLMERMPRRTFIIFTFFLCGIDLFLMGSGQITAPVMLLALFSIFATGISAASCVQYVYLPELFPVFIRASALGTAQSTSRIFASLITFSIPYLTQTIGIDRVLYLTAAWLAIGGIICWRYAPETRMGMLRGKQAG
ncbi:MFS transporter [Komagataeibacter sp. FNDCF1]|uniref:MFS transporter n=1 Tax=Komagataeibacter sp. FNDCF1 TaxID=2878681 RepID=UPI001E502854|nr:MFS transporter [Komagataeibacter sp. FNDCF1]MCE2565218.1 MFS transporter [Komagataeibacter sp. FNDCF1]